MKILFDTNILIWSLSSPELLSEKAKKYIQDSSMLYVSAASLWEMSIKTSIGKLELNLSELKKQLTVLGVNELMISWEHALLTETLPWHHKDPFDRLLIAQAMSEPLILLTNDKLLAQYTTLVKVV